MARRIAVEILLIVVLTIVLAWAIIGAVSTINTGDPAPSFGDQAPRLLIGMLGLGIGLWTVLVIIGAIVNRRRGAGWRIATHLVSLIVALGLNVVVLTVLTVASGDPGGWGVLVVAIAAVAGLAVLVAGVVVVLVVELLVLKNLPVPPPAVEQPHDDAPATVERNPRDGGPGAP